MLDDFYAHLSKDQALDIKHTFAYDMPNIFVGAAFEATPSPKAKRSLGSLSLASVAQPLVSSNFIMRKAESAPAVTSIHRDRYRVRSKDVVREQMAQISAHRRALREDQVASSMPRQRQNSHSQDVRQAGQTDAPHGHIAAKDSRVSQDINSPNSRIQSLAKMNDQAANVTLPTPMARPFGPHVLTGIDQQHALGRFGSGMKVCLCE